jgi:hypothetical protein
MPEESGSQQIGWQPDTQAPVQPPPQPPSNQSPPTPPASDDPEGDKATAKKLEDIAKGERWLIGIGIAGVLVNLLLGSIYYQQLTQMRIATEASRQAVQLARDTLDYNSSQFDRAMQQTIRQTSSGYIASRAAKSASDIAKDTLHVSERAYIVTGAASFDPKTRLASFPITNIGHIPSGDIEITFRVLAQNASQRRTISNTFEGYRWQKSRLPSLAQGVPMTFSQGIPNLDETRVNNGTQKLIATGFIMYNDGFPNSPLQRRNFCAETIWNLDLKKTITTPCDDPSGYLSQIEKLDGYPKNEGVNQPK